MQCQQLITLSAEVNISAIEALVNAPIVAGPSIAMPKIWSLLNVPNKLEPFTYPKILRFRHVYHIILNLLN